MHGNKSNTKDFILKARNIHGDRYCYIDSIYEGSRKKINIRCRKHGVFSQMVTNHLKGSGCQKCRTDIIVDKKSIGLDIIKGRIFSAHGDRYKYNFDGISKVTDMITITCMEHGDFRQDVRSHISGCGCGKCGIRLAAKSRTMSGFDFAERANLIHDYRYDYSLVNYNTARKHVNIICKKHGVFKQIPYAHLNGSGCAKCHGEKKIATNFGFNRKSFIKVSDKNNKKAILYVVRLSSDDEVFYKVGITTRSTEVRISKIHKYKKTIIKEVCGDAGFIYDLEKEVHEMCSNLRHKPLVKFDGYTECFSCIPKDLCNILDNHIIGKQINVGH